jgi:hypothetical protein
MKNLKFKLIALLVIISVVTACSIDNDNDNNYCFSQDFVATTSVNGPDSTTVNVPINIDVTFTTTNSCQTFSQFIEDTSTPKKIGALIDQTGCQCTTVNTLVTKPYSFNATTVGTYTLHFITANADAPIVKTVVVTSL